jgi:uncharacterized protein (TIRG00374 family)
MPKNRWRILVVVAVLVSLGLLFRGVDWPAAGAALAQLKGAAPLVLLPYLLQLAFDAAAWRYTFEPVLRFAWRDLFAIRLATDALSNSLPAGVAVAETMRAVLLRERLGMPVAKAATNLVISKLTVVLGQGLFVVLGLALAAPTLRDNSQRLIGRAGLDRLALLVSLSFLVAMGMVLALLAKGRLLGQLLEAAKRLAGQRSAHRLARLDRPCRELDHGLASVQRLGRRPLAFSVLLAFACWIAIGLETWTILRLLSPGVSLTQALSIEAILSIVRVLFFFLPAGLGAQEASYFALLAIYGVPHADVVAMAFVVAKRLKELVWIGTGYVLLWRLKAPQRSHSLARVLVIRELV